MSVTVIVAPCDLSSPTQDCLCGACSPGAHILAISKLSMGPPTPIPQTCHLPGSVGQPKRYFAADNIGIFSVPPNELSCGFSGQAFLSSTALTPTDGEDAEIRCKRPSSKGRRTPETSSPRVSDAKGF